MDTYCSSFPTRTRSKTDMAHGAGEKGARGGGGARNTSYVLSSTESKFWQHMGQRLFHFGNQKIVIWADELLLFWFPLHVWAGGAASFIFRFIYTRTSLVSYVRQTKPNPKHTVHQ